MRPPVTTSPSRPNHRLHQTQADSITTWTTPTGRTHTRPPTVLDTHVELGQIDPDTSNDLTLRALTGRHLPRPYETTEPGAIPGADDRTDPGEPPF
jgi:hypothetical protein